MADATSNESGAIDFRPYLQSISQHYQQWWTLYTLTDAEGKEELKHQTVTWDAPFDFGLTVQMVQKQSVPEAEESDPDRSSPQEKIEQLPVLEGIRKYADGHVLLVGRPGSGKSTALARLLLEECGCAAEPDREQPEQITVLVELRFWQTSIVDLIRNFFGRHDLYLDRSQIEHLLFHNRLLLLVDGLNELPSEAARQDVAKLRRDYPNVSAIFTTRDLNLGGDFGIEKKLEMQSLTTAQMQDFVRSHLEDQAELMLRQLGDRLRDFGQIPLLLWMLCSLFKQTGQIPTNLGGVFRAFTQSYERNLKQDIITESDRRWWSELLQALAFAMMHSRSLPSLKIHRSQLSPDIELRVAIPKTKAHQVFVECLKPKEPQPEGAARKCLDDLLRHHLIQANGDQIEFRHQLLQEYYAAEYLLTRVEQMSDLTLQQQYLNYLKWTEPLALMLALVENEGLAERVVNLALNVDWMLGARLAGEVKPQFEEKMVGFVEALEAPAWLRIQLSEKTQSDCAIPALLQLLKDSDSDVVRWSVVKALGKIKSEAAIPGLLQLLEDSDSDVVRWSVAEALGKIKSEAAIPGLLQLLEDSDSAVRGRAAEVLGNIGSEAAIPSLLQLLKDSNCHVRRSVAEVLGNIRSEAAIPGLLQRLEDSDSDVRRRAAEALGKIKSEAAIPGLLQRLEDSDSDVRGSVAEVLGNIGSEAAIPGLLQLLEDSAFGVRGMAAEMLGNIGSEAAIPGLLQLLEDSAFGVRESVAKALGNIGSEAAIPSLLQLLKDSNCHVRRSVAEVLGNIRSEAAIPGLLQLLEDSDSDVRGSAAEALGHIVEEQTDMIAQHLPHLLTLIPTDSSEDAHRVILAIQKNCKYYNYALTKTVDLMKLFFSYAHKDETLRDTLATHLALLKRQGIITTWHDRDITAGTEWAQVIDNNLNTGDIILLLISADFIHSDYCYDTEMQCALERHHKGEARVIPILLRPCDWEDAPFGKLQALPVAHGAGLKPVTQWRDQDEAFTAIAQGIRKAVQELRKARVG